MKRINLYYFLLVVLLFSCEKQTLEPIPMLSEYIIGDWEIREYKDFSAFGDWEFNSVGPPYLNVYRFKEDETFELWFKGNPEGPLSFSVNEQDSFLVLNSTRWKLFVFDENFIEIQIDSDEGPIGKRLHKIE